MQVFCIEKNKWLEKSDIVFGVCKIFYQNGNEFLRIDIGDVCEIFCNGRSGRIDSRIISDYLSQILHITSDWKEEYIDLSMIDGEDWKLFIYYIDGKVKKYYGHACFPINFDVFFDLNRSILKELK